MLDATHSPRLIMLGLALVTLGLGPVLYELSLRLRGLLDGLHGFVLGSVGTLVLFVLVPESVHQVGAPALVVAGLGLVMLSVVERVSHMNHERVHTVGRVLALIGLLLHTVLDGMAVHHQGPAASALGVAVVIHRLPVAVAVWWLVAPRFGRKAALIVLALAGLCTAAGFLVAGETLALLEGTGSALFTAFVSGALLHVVFHSHREGEATTGLRYVELVGAGLGVGLVAALNVHDHTAVKLWSKRLLDLSLASAPAILLGFVMAGFVVVLLPRAPLSWLRRGNTLTQAMRGTAFGIPIPICSCGVVPLYRSLIVRGAPPSAALAFLIATPELGIESLFLTVPLLGAPFTIARLLCAFVAALVVGLLIGQLLPTRSVDAQQEDPLAASDQPLSERLLQAVRYGLVDVVGDTAAWILVGLMVAATMDESVLGGLATTLPQGGDVLLAAVIGMPLYVCASGATPLAAALVFAGLSPGAALAFLLAGPATNVTTFGVLSDLHGKRIAIAFGAGVIGLSVLLGLAVNALLPAASVAAAQQAHHEQAGLFSYGALAILVMVTLYAVLKQGLAGFLTPVIALGEPGGHNDDHDHDHDDPQEASSCSGQSTCCGSC